MLWHTFDSINVSTELEMTPDERQNGGKKTLRQTLQVRVTSDTKTIQSSECENAKIEVSL